ncbi:hypothetical protein [Roseibacillus ishigakijimensis]|uniref:Peptidase C39-like domain-containing protein n=1 Tax=Roseibacillus ishigakijimensis TaxID=454146 RepID=A0A934VL70_9BACT|nr:hypothetical protein [Roseibacillus ishigakijimensis]MBK1832816.1 hypothetical protein [Roseibacillus ishigakijimensis]
MKTLALLLLCLLPLAAQQLDFRAPHPQFPYVDQNKGIGNSCGPAALLNAFGSGSEKWQAAAAKIPGDNDRARIASVIKSFGQKPSSNLPQRARWEIRSGVNFADLAVMADEFRSLQWGLPKVRAELYFASAGADSEKKLRLAHKQLHKSLAKGLPPILSVRRFVHRQGHWQSVHGHFVVLTALPRQLPRGSQSFPVEFVDSSGAKTFSGLISLATQESGLPCLVLHCPSSEIGKKQVRAGEGSALGLAGAIGAW